MAETVGADRGKSSSLTYLIRGVQRRCHSGRVRSFRTKDSLILRPKAGVLSDSRTPVRGYALSFRLTGMNALSPYASGEGVSCIIPEPLRIISMKEHGDKRGLSDGCHADSCDVSHGTSAKRLRDGGHCRLPRRP